MFCLGRLGNRVNVRKKRNQNESRAVNDLPDLQGPEFGPAEIGEIKQLVILCHGLGVGGYDLIGLAPYFAKVLPNARFIAPDAPFLCDMSPPGMQMGYQWFSLQERTEEAMLEGGRATAPILDKFIDDQLEKYNLPADRLALIGFSQGTMMSLFVGPRRAQQMAGILGYSGRLVGHEVFAGEVRSRPPVVLINGDLDDLVPVEVLPAALETLKQSGIEAEGHVRPGLGHSIDEEGLEMGIRFMERILT